MLQRSRATTLRRTRALRRRRGGNLRGGVEIGGYVGGDLYRQAARDHEPGLASSTTMVGHGSSGTVAPAPLPLAIRVGRSGLGERPQTWSDWSIRAGLRSGQLVWSWLVRRWSTAGWHGRWHAGCRAPGRSGRGTRPQLGNRPKPSRECWLGCRRRGTVTPAWPGVVDRRRGPVSWRRGEQCPKMRRVRASNPLKIHF
jgi:hypothetical protein